MTFTRQLRLAVAVVTAAVVSATVVAPISSPAHASSFFTVTVTVLFSDGAGSLTPVPGALVTVTTRNETSQLINELSFGDCADTLVANSTQFPDSLAARPLSAALGVPLALTPPNCVQPALARSLARSLARQGTELATLVGGPGALNPRVAAMSQC